MNKVQLRVDPSKEEKFREAGKFAPPRFENNLSKLVLKLSNCISSMTQISWLIVTGGRFGKDLMASDIVRITAFVCHGY